MGHLSLHDAVSVLDDQAFLRLTEDIGQPHSGDNIGTQYLTQNVARPHAGQLVGVPHHDDAAVVARRRKQGLKQLDIHHAHLIEDDDIIF